MEERDHAKIDVTKLADSVRASEPNMDSKDHAWIHMEKLADSLSGKLKTFHYPSSEDCCIYRVPQPRRYLHPNDYTPKMVSIGPLHHGKVELKTMEEHKLRYLHHFLQRTNVSMAHFLAFIKEKEAKLRFCYAESIQHESDEFLTMILVDAVFIIELLLRAYTPAFRTDDDPLFRKSGKSFLNRQMNYDLYLLENQLPLFIISELYDIAKTTNGNIYDGISFMTITGSWLSADVIVPISDRNLIETHFSKARHFLDLIILCLQPSPSSDQSQFNFQNIPGIKELHQAGVQFESGSRKNLLDIKFNNGTLGIPFFTSYGSSTELLYRNLLAFENMYGHSNYFSDYIVMVSFLLRTRKDADLLIEMGIIGLTDSEKLSAALQGLRKDGLMRPNFHYAGLVKDLQAYCKTPWHSWKANLRQNYFNSPWASISVIAAAILLLLTIIQTANSIIEL